MNHSDYLITIFVHTKLVRHEQISRKKVELMLTLLSITMNMSQFSVKVKNMIQCYKVGHPCGSSALGEQRLQRVDGLLRRLGVRQL